jgi:hypothetical protein
MKLLKLMLLMAFFSLGFSAISFGQVAQVQNTITRNKCVAYGCYKGEVTLKLSNTGPFIVSSTNIFPANQAGPISKDAPSSYKKIQVKVGGLTSIGNYYLPTAIGKQIIITDGLDDGSHHAYTVGIYKTANNQYELSIGDYAY